MQSESTIFIGNTNFSEQINPFTMIFKNHKFELDYKKYKFEKKNFLVLLGNIIFFNLFIIGLRSIQAFFNNYFDFRKVKVTNNITIAYMILCNLPIIAETIIHFIEALRILRGFAINIFPFIGIIIYSSEYCNNVYFTGTPMFITATVIYLPIAFITALAYSANWICGVLEVFCFTIIIIIGIIIMPGNPYLDKPWFILMMVSTFLAASITLYYFEYFQRKSIYMKEIAELQKESLEKILRIIPEPFIIAREGQVYYHNYAFSKIKLEDHIDEESKEYSEREINKEEKQITFSEMNITLNKISNIKEGNSLLNIITSNEEIKSEHFQIVNQNEKVKHFEISSSKIQFPNNESIIYFLKDLTDFDKMKELISKEKYQRLYVASITHDFRTPIGIILGNSEILFDLLKDDEPKYYIKNISQAANLLSLLVQDLLDYAQLKSEKLRLSPIYFNLKEEIEGLVKLFEEKYRDKGLYLKLEFYNLQTNAIFNDANRLKQVLMNLISNAFKFTRKGGITIKVEQLIESNYIAFDVIDTGIGISEQDIKQLFREYCRIESHQQLNPNGIGLGLHICQQLVQKLGGELSVKSTLNIGTTFSFFIKTNLILEPLVESQHLITHSTGIVKHNFSPPLKVNYEEEKGIKNDSPFALSNPNWFGDSKLIKQCNCSSILIVDDDPSIRNVLKSYSKKCSVSFDEAENGIKAIELVQAKILSNCCKWYNLILMDNEMPFMDGIQASQIIKEELKEIKENQTKIVLVSGYSDDDIIFNSKIDKELFHKTYTKPLLFQNFKEILYEI